MQTVTQKFSATIGEEKVELMLPTAVVEEADLPNVPRADIIAALNQSHNRGVKSAILSAVKVEGATAESVVRTVSPRAAEFRIYKAGARGRGASNAATQKDAAEALKSIEKLTGRKLTKDEYNALISKFAAELIAS